MKIIKPLELCKHLHSLGSKRRRVIGMDVGKLSIGVSLSDPQLLVANPLRIISRRDKTSVLPVNQQLHTIISKYGVSGFVVGLPTYKLRKTDSTVIVESFVAGLMGDFSNIDMCYWDEFGTTKNANLLLDNLKLTNSQRKNIGDKLASAGILQGFLDFFNNPGAKEWVGVVDSDSE